MTIIDDVPTTLARIHELIATRQYDWALPTLEGIARRIRADGVVTLRQQEAITHIMIGRLKHDVEAID